MTPLAQSLLAAARRRAVETQGQPDAILAEEYAALIQDMGRAIGGVTPGFLRMPPRHDVRPAKVQRPVVDDDGQDGAARA